MRPHHLNYLTHPLVCNQDYVNYLLTFWFRDLELERFENRKRKSITEKGDDAFKKMKTESDFDEHEVLVLRVPEVEYSMYYICVLLYILYMYND